MIRTFFLILLIFYLSSFAQTTPKQNIHKKPSDQSSVIQNEKQTLQRYYKKALRNHQGLINFFLYSEKLAKRSNHVKKHAYMFANLETKLLIHYIKKGDFVISRKILNHYMNKLLPFSGYHKKAEDIASNGIVLAILSKDYKLVEEISEKILGRGFDLKKANNPILLFNLSCFYAVTHQKEKMLGAIREALHHGKEPKMFLHDGDFKPYLKDRDFLSLLNSFQIKKIIDVDNLNITLKVKLSTGKSLIFNSKSKKIAIKSVNLPLYELLSPKKLLLSIHSYKHNKKITLVNDVTINDPQVFLRDLYQSSHYPLSIQKTVTSYNRRFSLGVKRENKQSILLFNAQHKSDHSNGIYNNTIRVDYNTYAKKVANLISQYKSLQKSLKDHVRGYLRSIEKSKVIHGLRVTLLHQGPLYARTKNQTFTVKLENVSDKPLHLMNPIQIKAEGSDTISIYVLSRPFLSNKTNTLKKGDSMTLSVKTDIEYTRFIRLTFDIANNLKFLNSLLNGGKIRQNRPFSHAYQGFWSQKFPIFTVKKSWQDDMNTSEGFQQWISKQGKK